MPYDRILELMSPPGHPNLFILGAFAKRVTVYSQQVRAINLIDAIHYYRRSLKNQRIAIVGAGAAGLSAAARALEYGATVTLFERNPDVMSIQNNSRHRWLHPTIYDWPLFEIGGEADDAKLPVMNWIAQDANKLASGLRTQWKTLGRKYGVHVRTLFPVEVTAVEPEFGNYRLQYVDSRRGSKRNHSEVFTLVVFAAGFGLEPEGAGRNSYWEQDPWDQIARPEQVVLVAGYGDGAMTDLMRVCLVNFEHKAKLIDVIENVPTRLLNRIRALEGNLEATNAAFLSEYYGSLRIPSVCKALKPFLNKVRTVVLTGRGWHLFDPRSSALNRLIVSQLLYLKAFRHYPLRDGEDIRYVSSADLAIARIEQDAKVKFTHFILRFGPESSTAKIFGLPPIIAPLEEKWKAITPTEDPTRVRLWERFAPIPVEIERSCVIFRPFNSDAGHDELLSVVDDAIRTIPERSRGLPQGGAISKEPVAISVQDCFRSDESLTYAARVLCRAPIAIFALGERMGQDNPAGMLLLGIRAAVRRGLTLVIHEGKLDIADWSALPFNLKELQVVGLEITPESAEHLANFIRSGLSNLQQYASAYRDLPAYEVVRRPERLTPRIEQGKVEAFVLCSFSADYTRKIWDRLRLLLRRIDLEDEVLEAKRVSDYSSPELVGERLYELTRHAGICIVDWTEWRANVFFEFGVRLAANPASPICILNRDHGGKLDNTRALLSQRFAPLRYSVQGKGGGDPIFLANFRREKDRAVGAAGGINCVYGAAERNILLGQEHGRSSYGQQVLQYVRAVLGPDVVQFGALPLLYGGNSDLKRQVWRGAVEALKAADLLLKWKIDRLAIDTDASLVADLRTERQSIQRKLLAVLDLDLDLAYRNFGEDIDGDD
jgi:hypothetical protein